MLSQPQLLRLIEAIEVPDCKCKMEEIKCGCEALALEYRTLARDLKAQLVMATMVDDEEVLDDLRSEYEAARSAAWGYERCECPTMYEECEHVKGIMDYWPDGITFDQWIALLWALRPTHFERRNQDWQADHQFADLPESPDVAVMIDRDIRAVVHEMRYPDYSIWHPLDIRSPEQLPDRPGTGIEGARRLVNGKDPSYRFLLEGQAYEDYRESA